MGCCRKDNRKSKNKDNVKKITKTQTSRNSVNNKITKKQSVD